MSASHQEQMNLGRLEQAKFLVQAVLDNDNALGPETEAMLGRLVADLNNAHYQYENEAYL